MADSGRIVSLPTSNPPPKEVRRAHARVRFEETSRRRLEDLVANTPDQIRDIRARHGSRGDGSSYQQVANAGIPRRAPSPGSATSSRV